MEDPIWQDILQHVHYGNCKEHHIQLLRDLIVTNSKAEIDYDSEPWNSALLVTPRHNIHHAWNTAMAKKHCLLTKQPLIVFHAVDTIGGHPLSLAKQYVVLTKTNEKKKPRESRFSSKSRIGGGYASNGDMEHAYRIRHH